MTSLAGRSAIVTGGGTGIGAACATRLAADGMDVTICGRRQNLLQEVADRIAASGAPRRVRTQVTDVTAKLGEAEDKRDDSQEKETQAKDTRNQAAAADYARFLHALWYQQLPHSAEILRMMSLPGIDRLYTDVPSIPEGTRVYNKTGSTAMCCGDMGILVARGRDGKTYPYAVIGIIESARKNTSSYSSWISRRADVIREVSNLVYLDMKKRHPL